MTPKRLTILDTGPSLNFFSAGEADLLLKVLENLSAEILLPEDVEDEIRRKASQGPTFSRSARVLDWALKAKKVTVLSTRTGQDPNLDRVVARMLGVPFEQRPVKGKDLGEMMVVAHASTLQTRGHNVIALMDDEDGKQLAANYKIRVITTIDVLVMAAQLGIIASWGQMRELYSKMEPHDSGLPTINAPRVRDTLRNPELYRKTAPATSV